MVVLILWRGDAIVERAELGRNGGGIRIVIRREQHVVKMAHLERKAAQLVLSRQNSASNLELNGHTMRFSQNHDHVEPATEEAEAKYLEVAIRASLSQVPTAPVILCQTDRNRLHICTKDLAPTSRR